MNSASRSCCVAERVTTAKRSHSNSPSSTITTFSEPPTSEAIASATSTTGMASRTTFLIDADGIVLDRFTSEITSQRPVERYREALAKLPAPTA